MRKRDEQVQRRGRALVPLVTSHLPQEFDVRTEADLWPVVGVALLARMTTSVESILDQQLGQRAVDAGILLRSVYEHAVHFAWLAADPTPARIEEWRKHDLVERLKADADTRLRGIAMLTDATRAEFESDVARMSGNPLVLADLAIAADAHWAGRLPGMGTQLTVESFRGWYALLYRYYSGMAHPSYRGLNPVFDEIGQVRRRVRMEAEYQGHGPYGLATVVFGAALFVSAEVLGWPSESEINAVFEHCPVDEQE